MSRSAVLSECAYHQCQRTMLIGVDHKVTVTSTVNGKRISNHAFCSERHASLWLLDWSANEASSSLFQVTDNDRYGVFVKTRTGLCEMHIDGVTFKRTDITKPWHIDSSATEGNI